MYSLTKKPLRMVGMNRAIAIYGTWFRIHWSPYSYFNEWIKSGESLHDVITAVGKDKTRLLADSLWFNVAVTKALSFKNKILTDMLIDVNFKILISLLSTS